MSSFSAKTKNKNDHPRVSTTGEKLCVLTQQAQLPPCGWGSCGGSSSLTCVKSSVLLSTPGNAAATLLKSCENIMSTNNII